MLTEELFYGTKKHHKGFFDLCTPIKHYLGITTASYITVDREGGMKLLCSNYKWLERFIDKSYFNQDPGMVHPNNMSSGFAFVTTSDDQEYKDTMLEEAIHEFNFHHGFCYVEKTDSTFTLFYFATDKENNNMVNKVVNAASLVKKLIRNLNKEIISKFTDLHDNQVDLFKLKNNLFLEQKGIVFNEDQENDQKIQILQNAGLISNNPVAQVTLTKQEIHCLRAYMEDHNIKNVAEDLNIATTTATDHIENIKRKLNCDNKQELLKIADILTGLGKI